DSDMHAPTLSQVAGGGCSLTYALCKRSQGEYMSMQYSRDANRSSNQIGQQRKRRATLLSGTSLAVLIASGVLFSPTGALAACADTGATYINIPFVGQVQLSANHTTDCDDTPTPETEAGTRNKLPTVNVESGAVITGEGLSANGGTPTFVGLPNLDHLDAEFNNEGSVTSDTFNGGDVLGYGLELDVIGLEDRSVRIGDATDEGSCSSSGGQHGINR